MKKTYIFNLSIGSLSIQMNLRSQINGLKIIHSNVNNIAM